jgi:superfamily I DNA and/or RNA helicase
VLEHLLDGHLTVPEVRGLLLEKTRRMHPAVCGFISEMFYEGRLESDAVCAGRTTPFGTGLRYLPVEHTANRQSAPEEARAVADEFMRLRKAGVPRQEILVVAAYNAQVRCLRECLPAGARIGTVDKFQGQEADVVFFSMASSSADDIPRGLEFLFSANRLNVAIFRARCLAYLVASPRLLEVECRSIQQMRLANALCGFVEVARLLLAGSASHAA